MVCAISDTRSSIGEYLSRYNVFQVADVAGIRYNLDYGLPGTRPGGETPEWELFDCQEDPLEIMNQYGNPDYAEIVTEMTALLDKKMLEIGDIPEHNSLRSSLAQLQIEN